MAVNWQCGSKKRQTLICQMASFPGTESNLNCAITNMLNCACQAVECLLYWALYM